MFTSNQISLLLIFLSVFVGISDAQGSELSLNQTDGQNGSCANVEKMPTPINTYGECHALQGKVGEECCLHFDQWTPCGHIKFDVCAEIIVYLKESILEVELIYNTHAFVDRNISFANPEPVCGAVPLGLPVELCIHFWDIKVNEKAKTLHFCAEFTIKVSVAPKIPIPLGCHDIPLPIEQLEGGQNPKGFLLLNV